MPKSKPRKSSETKSRAVKTKEPKPPQVDFQAVTAELCRRSLAFFVQEFWEEVITGDACIWNWHMQVICDEVQAVYERVFQRLPKKYDLIINVPPGSSKSTIVSIMAPVWSWIRDPTLRHITASYAADLAESLSEKSRLLLTSAKFMRMFPHIQLQKGINKKEHYANTFMGERKTASTRGAITGFHAHIITGDDLLNPLQAASAAELKTGNDWMDGTLLSRKTDKALTPFILMMQRLGTKDPTGHMLSKVGKVIRHVCLPAEFDSAIIRPAYLAEKYKNGLLDERRIGHAVCAEAKLDMGTARYAAQFQQRPVPDGGLIWKRWFIPVPDEVFPRADQMDQYGTDWDLAVTEKEANSACAYVTAGKFNHRTYIDDIGFGWFEFPELIRYMKARPAPHYIEAKSAGQSSKQVLVRQGVAAIEVPVIGGDKTARANMATPNAEAGLVYVRASILEKLYSDPKQGILFFPKGSHTDLADALAQSLQRLGGRSSVIIAGENKSQDAGPMFDELPVSDPWRDS